VQKVTYGQKLVKHFTLFFESLLLHREVPKLELRRGSDVTLEL
jgi:hypothetical protein